jgi:hypothetical protein
MSASSGYAHPIIWVEHKELGTVGSHTVPGLVLSFMPWSMTRDTLSLFIRIFFMRTALASTFLSLTRDIDEEAALATLMHSVILMDFFVFPRAVADADISKIWPSRYRHRQTPKLADNIGYIT